MFFIPPLPLDFYKFLPETFLFISILILLISGVFFEKVFNNSISFITITISYHALLVIFLLLVMFFNQDFSLANEFFVTAFDFCIADKFSGFFKIFLLLFAGFFLLLLHPVYEKDSVFSFEFIVLILFSILGYFLLLSSYNFLMLYLSLELSSFCLYLLATFKKNTLFSTESGLKYFILGSFSSGLLLFGISLVYGCSGTIFFSDFLLLYSIMPNYFYVQYSVVLGLFLVFSGILFKLGVVPFHFWSPDVYDGAPTLVTAYFSTITKIAIVGLFFRLLHEVFYLFFPLLSPIFLFLGMLSILIGTLGALYQNRIKRFIAYSGITHSGYLLIALSVESSFGLIATVLYLLIYTVLNLNFFSTILSVRKVGSGLKIKNLDDLSTLFRSDSISAVNFSLNLFSMAGIPPLAGFFSKLYVFMALIQSGFIFYSVIIVLLSVISSVYYLRLIKIMFFEKPFKWSFYEPFCFSNAFVLILSLGFNIFFIVFQDFTFLLLSF